MSKSVEKRRKKMREAVKFMQDYWVTYSNQSCYEDYRTTTFLDDAVYAIGISLDKEKFKCANGYRKFINEVLIPHLKKSGNLEEDSK